MESELVDNINDRYARQKGVWMKFMKLGAGVDVSSIMEKIHSFDVFLSIKENPKKYPHIPFVNITGTYEEYTISIQNNWCSLTSQKDEWIDILKECMDIYWFNPQEKERIVDFIHQQ